LIRPDLDNLIKAFMDAALKEDSGVYKIRATKKWDTEDGVVIKIL